MQTLRKNATIETEGQSKASDPTVIIFFSHNNNDRFTCQAAGSCSSSAPNEQVQFHWYLHSHDNRAAEGADPEASRTNQMSVYTQFISMLFLLALTGLWFGGQLPLPLLLHHFVKLHSGSGVLHRRVTLLPSLDVTVEDGLGESLQ